MASPAGFVPIKTLLNRPGATRLDVDRVDLTGQLSAGALTSGDNPVLMTLEAVLTPD